MTETHDLQYYKTKCEELQKKNDELEAKRKKHIASITRSMGKRYFKGIPDEDLTPEQKQLKEERLTQRRSYYRNRYHIVIKPLLDEHKESEFQLAANTNQLELS
jgi:hypothetical protein